MTIGEPWAIRSKSCQSEADFASDPMAITPFFQLQVEKYQWFLIPSISKIEFVNFISESTQALKPHSLNANSGRFVEIPIRNSSPVAPEGPSQPLW
jgi:hypothetical protein